MHELIYCKKLLLNRLILATITSIGISDVHAGMILILDGKPGHVIDGQTTEDIGVAKDGTKVEIKNTTINGWLKIADAATVVANNNTISCNVDDCEGVYVQGMGHIANIPGTVTRFSGSDLAITSTGTGLRVSASSIVNLTNVTVKADGYGFDFNGSVTQNNVINKSYINGFNIISGREGIHGMFGSQLYLANGSVLTTADKAMGVYLGGANYSGSTPIQTTAYLQNVKVHTKGDGAYGLFSEQMSGRVGLNRGAISYWDNSHILTEGKNSPGIVASYTSNEVTLSNGSTIHTTGVNSYGSWSLGRANITLNNSQIMTQGTDAPGVVSYHYGKSYLQNSSQVVTQGEGAHGAMVQYAGKISLTDSAIYTQGIDAHGIYMLTGQAETNAISDGSIVNLQHSSVTADRGYGIATAGGSLQVNVLDGSIITGRSGLMNVQDYTGSDKPKWKQGITTVNLLVDGGSVVAGKVQIADSAIANMTLSNRSLWQFDSDSTLHNLTNDHSTIQFSQSLVRQLTTHTLTVNGDYTGNEGLIIINTQLGDDDSPTDKLIINGDTSGNTYVQVNNLGGQGGITFDDIEVIEVKGNSAGTFTQNSRIIAGAYEYSLVRGAPEDETNPNNWYLTSSPYGETHVLRPEVGSYLANLAAANTMFNLRLYDRQGEHSYIDFATGQRQTTSMWLRYAFRHNKFGVSNQFDVTNNWYVAQLGGDIAAWSLTGSDRLSLGIMAGYGHSTNDAEANLNGNRSSAKVDGYSLGLYSTWFENRASKTGFYIDSWIMWNILHGQVDGQDLNTEKYDLRGINLSLESGYSWLAAAAEKYNIWLQPQAQLIWMDITPEPHLDDEGSTITSYGDNILSRLGLRTMLEETGHNPGFSSQFFVEANWLYYRKAFSVKMNNDRVYQLGARNIAEMKAGFESKLYNDVNVWANVGYQRSEHKYSNLTLMVGGQIRF